LNGVEIHVAELLPAGEAAAGRGKARRTWTSFRLDPEASDEKTGAAGEVVADHGQATCSRKAARPSSDGT
jgi:hypothetical protein